MDFRILEVHVWERMVGRVGRGWDLGGLGRARWAAVGWWEAAGRFVGPQGRPSDAPASPECPRHPQSRWEALQQL